MDPSTHLSLLHRLSSGGDEEAWADFVRIYSPVIFRTLRFRGLQDADAHDVLQQILMSVKRSLEERRHDPSKAKFRTWLSVVTRNATINALSRRRPDHGSGDTDVQRRLDSIESDSDEEALFDREFEREVFRKAASMIENDFDPATWRAFWATTVEGHSIESIAEELSKKPGSIYTARSRVMRRLRDEVKRLTADWNE